MLYTVSNVIYCQQCDVLSAMWCTFMYLL